MSRKGSIAKKFETGSMSDSLLRFSNIQPYKVNRIEDGSTVTLDDLGHRQT